MIDGIWLAGFGVLIAAATALLTVLLRRSYLDAGQKPSTKRGFDVIPMPAPPHDPKKQTPHAGP